jgi:hypothetical protein
VVFSKARPATLEEYITLAIIVDFYFVWWSIARHFSKNSFVQLPALHEFSEYQREALLIALGTNKSKNGEDIPIR